MTNLPFRSMATALTDAELVLLDVLFNGNCQFRILRDDIFRAQWNFAYSHGLSDDELRSTLTRMCDQELLFTRQQYGRLWFCITKVGFDQWARERCPKWERFCTWHTRDSSRGHTRLTVTAVSQSIGDDFIRYWPPYPSQRRRATITDNGLVPFHSLGTLHVGLATYTKPQIISTSDELQDYTEVHAKNQATIDEHRSWWGTVPQLQRFQPNNA